MAWGMESVTVTLANVKAAREAGKKGTWGNSTCWLAVRLSVAIASQAELICTFHGSGPVASSSWWLLICSERKVAEDRAWRDASDVWSRSRKYSICFGAIRTVVTNFQAVLLGGVPVEWGCGGGCGDKQVGRDEGRSVCQASRAICLPSAVVISDSSVTWRYNRTLLNVRIWDLETRGSARMAFMRYLSWRRHRSGTVGCVGGERVMVPFMCARKSRTEVSQERRREAHAKLRPIDADAEEFSLWTLGPQVSDEEL
eukprot:scaffold1377_cov126-Cylindrotheca_fusiformis.AAC.8